MLTIHKYQLPDSGTITIHMPKGAQVLCVQAQDDVPRIWALIDENQLATEARTFNIYGTGWEIPSSPGRYIGTFQLEEGRYVFHVFEGK